MLVESPDSLPGTRPPTSAWCAVLATKPISSRAAKTGAMIAMSFKWEPALVYGSFATNMSPGRHERRGYTSARARGRSTIEERCIGMCAAWAITRPSASNTAQEASRRSLMLGEYAARMSVMPISSAVASKSRCSTSTAIRSMGSRSSDGDHEVAVCVHRGRLTRLDDGRAIDLLDHRGAGDRLPRGEAAALEHGRLHEPLGRLEIDRTCAAGRLAGLERAGDGRTRDRERRRHPERHQLGRLLRRCVAERAVVR